MSVRRILVLGATGGTGRRVVEPPDIGLQPTAAGDNHGRRADAGRSTVTEVTLLEYVHESESIEMKHIAFALWVGLAWCATAEAQSTPQGDEARIRTIIASQDEAWNRGDATAYAATFRSDGVFTIIVGTTYHTRMALQERVADILAGVFKGSVIAHSIQSIRFVRPDVAIVEIETEMKRFQALPPGVRGSADGALRTAMLQVLVRENGGWSVAAFHNVDMKTR